MPRGLHGIWQTLRRSKLEEEMAVEMRHHLESRAADLMRKAGLCPAEAVRRARVEFGSVENYKEHVRASLGLRVVDELRTDIRFAFRMFAKDKGFVCAAAVILALGIGANVAVFSVVDAMLFRSLPVANPTELVAFDTLHTRDTMLASYTGNGRPGPGGTSRRTSFSALTFERFRDQATTLSHVFAFAPLFGAVTVSADASADVASAQVVSGGYYDGLGVKVVLGRTLGPADDRLDAQPAAVVSHRYWQRRFAGAPDVVGKEISVNRLPFTIVGVTDPSFHGTEISETVDITLPLAFAAQVSATGEPRPISNWWLLVMGRARPAATPDQVRAELLPIFEATVRESWAARPLATRDPGRTGMPALRVGSGARGPNGPLTSAWQNLAFLFGITAVVLLIACVNIAALLLVRATNRSPEIAMRRALGATQGRLVRQLLSESLLLAIVGAIVGLGVAVWAKDFIPRMMEDDVALDTFIDLRTLAFAAGLTTLTALIFGTGHAVRGSTTDALAWVKGAAVKGIGRRALVARSMIAVQVAASVMLLVMAGLFIRTIHNLGKVDVGFEPRNLLVFRLDPGPIGEKARVFDLYERLVTAIEAVPGVRAATLSVLPIVAHSEWSEPVRPDDGSRGREAFIQAVRWNFFETMGIPIIAGRSLSASDAAGRPRVAVINEAMAKQFFGVAVPLGRHFQFANGSDRDVPIEVVGVVGNTRYARLEEAAPPPTFFMPHSQLLPQSMTMEVRTSANPVAFAPAIREAIRREDPGLALIALRTQEQQIAGTIRAQRVLATISVVSGVIGLMLACVGLYGIVSYDAKRRTSEIGVRMALGARPRDIIGLVSGRTLRVVSVGGLLGLLLAAGAARLVANQLFGVTPLDVPAMVAATLLMATVACIAAYIPARRASRLEPMIALRCE